MSRFRVPLVVLVVALAAAATAWGANVHGTLRVDPEVPLGTDPVGRLRLYSPDPVDPGSSISHWDMPASPDLLMEPFIAPGTPIGEIDLTVEQLKDIGWASGSSHIVVHYIDPSGQGFNAAGSLGTQRRAAIERVAEIWGGLLESSVPIHLDASFQSLPCSDGSATLAQAGPTFIFESFSGAHIQHAWYPGALAESLAGQNLSLHDDVDPQAGDINAIFNTGIDNGCLGGGATFDYALDGTTKPGRLSFVNVALHEIGHGLGFVSFVNEGTGANPMGLPDIYSFFTRDTSSGLLWHQMNDAERVASARNTGRLVWDGPNVNSSAPSLLTPGPVLQIDSPASVHGSYEVAGAQFGPPLSEDGIDGLLVAADDGTASRAGCQPFTNAAAMHGQIALVVRGGCDYNVKVKNAQNAGASAVIVVNNVDGPTMMLGGTDPSITIPSVMVRQDDGNELLAASGVTQPAPTSTPPPSTPQPPPPNPDPTPTKTPTPPAPPAPSPTPWPTTQPPASGSDTLDPVVSHEAPGTCVENGTTLCLENHRFRVRMRWTTRAGATGDGHAAGLTSDSGYFWFFDPANVELVIKVKNACASAFNSFWFFAAGLTDVDVVIQVADTKNGRVLTYHNPQGRPFPPVQDTDAFPTCP